MAKKIVVFIIMKTAHFKISSISVSINFNKSKSIQEEAIVREDCYPVLLFHQ